MDDDLFFDELYQLWSKTSGKSSSFWMPVEYVDGTGRWKVYSVDTEDDSKLLVASELSEADAEFVAGIHGAVSDLIRVLHESVDEAARKDEARDLAEAELHAALLENMALRDLVYGLERMSDE